MLHQYSASGIEPMCSASEATSPSGSVYIFSSHTRMPAVITQSCREITAGMAKEGSAAFIVSFTAFTSRRMAGQPKTRITRQAATDSMKASMPGLSFCTAVLCSSKRIFMMVGIKHTKSIIRIGVVKTPPGFAMRWKRNSMVKMAPVITSTSMRLDCACGPKFSISGMDSSMVFMMFTTKAACANPMKTRPKEVCRFRIRVAALAIVTLL
mmetsp:Transcript_98892/g.235891  ORF Transcript_98892/g.235891 Transcript_98892/m.235891 type:complete len:210 (+) Transcript_98892:341-970(+)